VPRNSSLGFDADPVVHGGSHSLPAAKVSLFESRPAQEGTESGPVRRPGAGMAAFALQVNDRPVLLSQLDVTEIQIHRFVPPKATGEGVPGHVCPSTAEGQAYSRAVATDPSSANSQAGRRSS
jgi:hypothetical protein